jgi:fucose 4-O-acetylase-like acetyltransferase
MGPLRVLLFFIWFPVLYGLFRHYEFRIQKYSRGVLEMLGRNSLFVYSAHAFIIFTLKMYFIPPATSFLQNFIITSAGLILLISITAGYTRLIRPAVAKLELRPKLKFSKA